MEVYSTQTAAGMFIPFLAHAGLYERFENNCERFGTDISELLKNEDPLQYFERAFRWVDTPECDDFWHSVEELWMKELTRHGYFNEKDAMRKNVSHIDALLTFEQFLTHHGLVDEFEAKIRISTNEHKTLKDYVEGYNHDPYDMVLNAFMFWTAPHNVDWWNVNEKWVETLNSNFE